MGRIALSAEIMAWISSGNGVGGQVERAVRTASGYYAYGGSSWNQAINPVSEPIHQGCLHPYQGVIAVDVNRQGDKCTL